MNERVELYNSKIKLMNWLFEEIKLQPDNLKNELSEKVKKLPFNC